MKMKTFLAGALTVSMLTTASATIAYASETDTLQPVLISEETAAVSIQQYDKNVLSGTVASVRDGQVVLNLENETQYAINYDENTMIMDTSVLPLSPSEIAEGDNVTVIASKAATFSLPPQSYGYIIMVQKDENVQAPIYAEVAAVNNEDGTIDLTSADGMYVIRMTEDTVVTPYLTRNYIRAEDITVGSKVLVNASIMTMSIPAQVPAESVVVLELGNQEAAPAEPEDTEDEVQNEQILTVQTVSNEDGLEFVCEDGTIVRVKDDTVVEAYKTKNILKAEDITPGSEIIADGISTRSLPPQIIADKITVVSLGQQSETGQEEDEQDAAEKTMMVASVSHEGENTELTCEDGTIVRLTKDTVVRPYSTKNILTAQDITPGSEIIVHADIMTASIPAQMIANEVIVVSLGDELADDEVDPGYSYEIKDVVVNGQNLNVQAANGLVPVRAVAEALGYEVSWSEELQAIRVGTVPMGVTFNIGVDSYTKAKMTPIQLGVAPQLLIDDAGNGITYVPVSFFSELLEATVEETDTTVSITQ